MILLLARADILVHFVLLSTFVFAETLTYGTGQVYQTELVEQPCRYVNFSGLSFDFCTYQSTKTNLECTFLDLKFFANPFSHTVNGTCSGKGTQRIQIYRDKEEANTLRLSPACIETPICLRSNGTKESSLGDPQTLEMYHDNILDTFYARYTEGDACLLSNGTWANYSSEIEFRCSESEQDAMCGKLDDCKYYFAVISPKACRLESNASTSTAYGRGLSMGKAGEMMSFTIETLDSTGQPTYYEGDQIDVHFLEVGFDVWVESFEGALYNVSYNTCTVGLIGIEATLNKEALPFSGMLIEFNPGNVAHLYASGQGILPDTTPMYIYEEEKFSLSAHDSCENSVKNYSVEVSFEPIRYVSFNGCVVAEDASHSCVYATSVIGNKNFTVEIYPNGGLYGPFFTMPFEVGVEAMSFFGPGVDPTGTIFVGDQQTFNITAEDSLGNPPIITYEFLIWDSASLISSASCSLINPDELCCYTCTYDPSKTGSSNIYIFAVIGGTTELAGGPFDIVVEEHGSSSVAPPSSDSDGYDSDELHEIHTLLTFGTIVCVVVALTLLAASLPVLSMLSPVPIYFYRRLRPSRRKYNFIPDDYDSGSEDSFA